MRPGPRTGYCLAMPHCIVPAAEELLDKEIPVLDKGFVQIGRAHV